jgi:hypothetical protein
VVRQGSAKASSVGSIPTLASSLKHWIFGAFCGASRSNVVKKVTRIGNAGIRGNLPAARDSISEIIFTIKIMKNRYLMYIRGEHSGDKIRWILSPANRPAQPSSTSIYSQNDLI